MAELKFGPTNATSTYGFLRTLPPPTASYERYLHLRLPTNATSTYGFKPADSIRTFGQILAHIAGPNYVFCGAAKGEKPPYAEDEFEKSATTKADIVKALGDSLGYCDAVYAGLDDKKAGEVIDMPFGMGRSPRAGALMGNTGHLQEHYGNLVTYFRIKGIVPPSSRRQ